MFIGWSQFLAGSLAVEWAKIKNSYRRGTVAVLALFIIPLNCLFVFSPPWHPALVHPHYLAYFNELAGGPRNGYKYLVDSNLDWGQELMQLKGWLQKRNINRPLGLCYFGMADPRYYAIAHDNLPGGYPFEAERSFDILHSGSLFAISATNLQGVLYTAQRRKKWDRILQESKLGDTVDYSIFIYEFHPGSPL